MKKLLIFFLAIGAGCKPESNVSPPKTNIPQTLSVPATGAYTGAYIDFGDNEDDVTLDKIESFEKLVGKHQAIVASSSYWGEQTFPTTNIQIIVSHQSIPLIFWSPWDKPYDQDIIAKNGPDRFNLNAINEGKWDAYIDAWGDAAKAIGNPMFVSFGNEMNGNWFPWSGKFYGGKDPVPGSTPEANPTPLPGYHVPMPSPCYPPVGPEIYKRAFRHVVDRVRARGASNVLWVFHANNYAEPNDLWNVMAQYYPGSDYVDWLGLSVYGEQFNGVDAFSDFAPLFDWPVTEIHALDPSKPVMLAEWGVGEFPKEGSKALWFKEAFDAMERKPFLKAAVFWHERWQNVDDSYSNLHVNSTPEALAAYRQGVAGAHWLDRPQLHAADIKTHSPATPKND
ncbi:MAG: glycosyl hydrolase [Chthoniobacterales bacterium]